MSINSIENRVHLDIYYRTCSTVFRIWAVAMAIVIFKIWTAVICAACVSGWCQPTVHCFSIITQLSKFSNISVKWARSCKPLCYLIHIPLIDIKTARSWLYSSQTCSTLYHEKFRRQAEYSNVTILHGSTLFDFMKE